MKPFTTWMLYDKTGRYTESIHMLKCFAVLHMRNVKPLTTDAKWSIIRVRISKAAK